MAVDDLLYVAAAVPPDGKAQVIDRRRQCGGQTANALVAAARLGARCAYAGTLGDDDLSRFAIDGLTREGVDISHLARRPEARPIHCTIVVDRTSGSRTVYYDLAGAVGASIVAPSEDVIRDARVLLIDTLGMDGQLRAARIAREARRPIVADFESDQSPLFAELLSLVDHLILGEVFARRFTGAASPADAARALWTEQREAVVVTCGADGCWWLAAECGGRPRHMPAFAVDAIDTTGCGDVFHGAYAAELARGAPLVDRLRFASAAAAIKARSVGAQAGIPTRAVVERFQIATE